MLKPSDLYIALTSHGISFYAGVPDSLLKDFCAYVTDNVAADRNIICANEGAAVAAATGHYLATGEPGLVYMQNSGFGNTVNPLLSLADPDVYSIPMMLLIGWRGEPGKKDEPQHVKQGKVMPAMLDAMQIPYRVIDETTENPDEVISSLSAVMKSQSRPVALVARAGTFEPYTLQRKVQTSFELNRESALKLIIDRFDEKDIVVGTTGMTSREIFEYREALGHGHSRDFLTVGSMGHASQIALGIALAKPDRQVFCLDGDGALLMHMGSLTIIGTQSPKNFKHIVINNGAHDSVGGQPTAGFAIDFCQIARGCLYHAATCVDTSHALTAAVDTLRKTNGPALLEVRVNKGSRKDLGRPTTTPIENKQQFMKFLNERLSTIVIARRKRNRRYEK